MTIHEQKLYLVLFIIVQNFAVIDMQFRKYEIFVEHTSSDFWAFFLGKWGKLILR